MHDLPILYFINPQLLLIMNALIFAFSSVVIGLACGASNSCIDLNLSRGYSFSESVSQCQSKATKFQITTTTWLPTIMTLPRVSKTIPPRFLHPIITPTKLSTNKIQSYLPYLLASSAILSLTAIISKFSFSFHFYDRFFL